MNKSVLLGAGSFVAAAVGLSYYVSPAATGDLDVPPLVTIVPPQDAVKQMERLSFQSFSEQFGRSNGLGLMVQGKTRKTSADTVEFDLLFMGDKLLEISATASETSLGKTQVDIQPHMSDSRLSRNPELHPFDAKALVALADVMATEYVDSVLNQRRMANGDEMKSELQRRIGFSEDQWKAFGDRFERAVNAEYRTRMRSSADVSSWYPDSMDNYQQYQMEEARRRASERVSDAAENAASAASAAAAAAAAAARR